MTPLRQSFKTGHRRKFLVVIDETPECDRALYYAARRAQRTGGALVFLYVIARGEFQNWLGVEALIRAEAEEEARKTLFRFVDRARQVAGVEPEIVIREGMRADEALALIAHDHDIAILILAAGSGSDGPGPLVSMLTGRMAASFPIPVTIVPGGLTDEEIDALS